MNPNAKITILLASLGAVATAHGQTLFSTGFESPIYSNGVSAQGVYGWDSGYIGGTVQKVTNARALVGSQSLLFDNSAATTTTNALRQTLKLGTTGTLTASVNVWLSGTSGSGRLAEFRFTNGSNAFGDYFMSVDGSGAVRMGRGVATYDVTSATNPLGFANVGSYTDRWLKFTMAYNSTSGLMSLRTSGFGAGQSDFTATATGFTGGGYVELVSAANGSAANRGGQVYFDNLNVVGPNPVPEPASMAVLGIGAMGVMARRRRRS